MKVCTTCNTTHTATGFKGGSTKSCQIEEATNKVLGWVRIPLKGWGHVYLEDRMLGWERVVSTRFRWPSR